MALFKEIPTPSGVVVVYWRIFVLHGEFTGNGRLEVLVEGYLSAAHRLAGCPPVPESLIRKEYYGVDAGRMDIYAMLKLEPEFDGALDV